MLGPQPVEDTTDLDAVVERCRMIAIVGRQDADAFDEDLLGVRSFDQIGRQPLLRGCSHLGELRFEVFMKGKLDLSALEMIVGSIAKEHVGRLTRL